MAGGTDNDSVRGSRRLERVKLRRSNVISQIKAVHELALQVEEQPDLGPTVTYLTADLDSLWTQFRFEDDAVLDGLTELDRLSEFSS